MGSPCRAMWSLIYELRAYDLSGFSSWQQQDCQRAVQGAVTCMWCSKYPACSCASSFCPLSSCVHTPFKGPKTFSRCHHGHCSVSKLDVCPMLGWNIVLQDKLNHARKERERERTVIPKGGAPFPWLPSTDYARLLGFLSFTQLRVILGGRRVVWIHYRACVCLWLVLASFVLKKISSFFKSHLRHHLLQEGFRNYCHLVFPPPWLRHSLIFTIARPWTHFCSAGSHFVLQYLFMGLFATGRPWDLKCRGRNPIH